MKRMIALGGLMLWALAAGAEARSWGFDKDTVYEWNPGGDTVMLVNNGADTLKLDSVFAENVDSSMWGNAGFIYGAIPEDLNQFTHRSIKLGGPGTPPGQAGVFRSFRVADAAPTARISATSPLEGDTVMVRLMFKSVISEYDTLIVKGVMNRGSSIRSQRIFKNSPKDIFPARDILGRQLTPALGHPVSIQNS